MNPLEINKDDINHLFDVSATDILVDDSPEKGIITNSNLSDEAENKHLHTLNRVPQGSLVTYQEEQYLSIIEVITKRQNKYKTIIRHCNYSIKTNDIQKEFIGYDDNGRPLYEETSVDVYVPMIMDNKSFTISGSFQIRVPDSKIHLTVQDNEYNVEKLKTNTIIPTVHGQNYKIRDHDYTQKGLIIMTAEFTASDADYT